MQDLARGAGQIVKDKFHTAKTWRQKTDRGDIVTEVDELSEAYIVDRITKEYPEHCLMCEEGGMLGNQSGDYVWIVDPIDGTRNYMIGIPFFCVSVGIARNGVAEIGVIYDPIHDEMFFAERGKGAFLNGEPITVSAEKSLEDSVVNVSWVKRKVDGQKFVRYVDEISHHTSYFRRLGSAALVMAYIACGRLDAYMQGGLNPWDVAAGVVLIEEAGGIVTDFKDLPIDLTKKDVGIVAANPAIHSILIDKIIGKHM